MLHQFELRDKLCKFEQTATDTYAMFVAEPFEAGFAHSLDNAFRRILLSSIEGVTMVAVTIEGVSHEFQSVPGIKEDVADMILNIKRILFQKEHNKLFILTIDVNREGPALACDIVGDGAFERLNLEQVICNLDKKHKFFAPLELRVGRGYFLGSQHERRAEIRFLPVDALFSPVTLVKYAVEDARVGQITDYNKLILEIWTDGRIMPTETLKEAI
jgi:DNA-directed RNA polymerase subunit alpha